MDIHQYLRKTFLILGLFISAYISFVSVSGHAYNDSLTQRLRGHILLQVQENGEAWYVNPLDNARIYMRDGLVAYDVMANLGLGISNANLAKIRVGVEDRFDCNDSDGDGLCDKLEEGLETDPNNPDTDGDGYPDRIEVLNGYNPLGADKLNFDQSLADRLRGRIVLQVEKNGQAWYINPRDGLRYYMRDGEAAYQIMRFLSLGISNSDLAEIPISSYQTPTNPIQPPSTPDPDPAIAKIDASFDQAQWSVAVTVRNLGGSQATNVPVELYVNISGGYSLQSSALVTVPAHSLATVDMTITDFTDLQLGQNDIKIIVNPASSPSHITESFPFNNNLETYIVVNGVDSVITFLDSNGQPANNTQVEAFDISGAYLGWAGADAQGKIYFESLPGQMLKFKGLGMFDTQAGPGNPTIDCLADETEYMVAPVSATMYLPPPSHFVYINPDGSEPALRFVSATDIEGDTVCMNIASGVDMNLYIKPDTSFRVGPSSGSEYWTPFITAPTTAYYCEAGNCCIDGTQLGKCSGNQASYCSSGGELVDNCQVCGCPRGLYCNESNVCVTDYIIGDPL